METETLKKKPFVRKPKKVDADYLHRAALYYLQRFAASRARLGDVLLRKVARRLCIKSTVAPEVQSWQEEISKLLNRYEENGLLNDAALADARVESLRRAGGSARNITQKLKQKGFQAATISTALTEHEESENVDDEVAIKNFMKKKKLGLFRLPGKVVDEKLKKREIAALLRAGYNYQLVRRMMDAEEFMPVDE